MSQRTVVVSDLHLIPEFDKKKFSYLKSLFTNADRLIVNGDFWSYYYSDFSELVNSEWSKLFPIMLSKECVYIYGNHDRKRWCGDDVNLFSVASHDRYTFKQDGLTFHVQHGHLISGGSIENETLVKFFKKHRADKYNYAFHNFVIKKLGVKLYSRAGRPLNRKHKRFMKKNIPAGDFLVCGHTHAPEESLEKRYINTGFINYGISSYLLIDDGVRLVKEPY